ncbi:MAG: hypothetical protein UY13_C0002G0183 [Candidatus Pacebacteria bacterium GW2011_GWB1_47_8]|nr:MAG: hypothetical protein UY13_C0002G0183 [Candidatus Pacebacteria bacterium GW2011_GWB1_47_8]
MNDKKFIIAVVAVTAFLLLGGIVLATRMTNPKRLLKYQPILPAMPRPLSSMNPRLIGAIL